MQPSVYLDTLLELILGEGAYPVGSTKDPQTYVHAGEALGAQVILPQISQYLASYRDGAVLRKLVEMCVDKPMVVKMPLCPMYVHSFTLFRVQCD